MEQLIQFASLCLYQELWGENDVWPGENVDRKKGERDFGENHD